MHQSFLRRASNHVASFTRVLHKKLDVAGIHPAATPIFQNSAFESHSPYFYSRKDNPNTSELEWCLAELEGAKSCVATTNGMAALNLAMSLVPQSGVVVSNLLMYGCTYKLIQRMAGEKRARFSHKVVDMTAASGLQEIAKLKPAFIVFETPTNPFLKTIDIRAISAAAKIANPACLVCVDNTWGTSIFSKPLNFGADLSVHSLTKYVSGHSDVMGGCVMTNDEQLGQELKSERFYTGANLDPHSSWLLRRSLQTFPVRLKQQSETTKVMRDWLRTLPQIAKVYYPDLTTSQLSEYGGILFAQLRKDLVDVYPDFLKAVKYFGSGTGMACVTSMIAQPYSGSHASMTAEEKAAIGLGPDLIRFCFGLEDPADLKADILQAFKAAESKRVVELPKNSPPAENASWATQYKPIRPAVGAEVAVKFVQKKTNTSTVVHGRVGQSVLDVAIDNKIDIEGACDGTMNCSTCHVIVDKEAFARLPPMDEPEQDMLDIALEVEDTSRLGCQVILQPPLAGMELTLPTAVNHNVYSGS